MQIQVYIRIILDVLMHFTCQLLEPSLENDLEYLRDLLYGIS